MHDFLIRSFQSQMDYIFFLYGFSFFFLGLIALFMRKAAVYGLHWRFFGLFGLLQGIYAWMNLFAVSIVDTPAFIFLRLFVFLLSFSCLIEFCRKNSLAPSRRNIPVWLYAFTAAGIGAGYHAAGLSGVDIALKYIPGLCDLAPENWSRSCDRLLAKEGGSRWRSKDSNQRRSFSN